MINSFFTSSMATCINFAQLTRKESLPKAQSQGKIFRRLKTWAQSPTRKKALRSKTQAISTISALLCFQPGHEKCQTARTRPNLSSPTVLGRRGSRKKKKEEFSNYSVAVNDWYYLWLLSNLWSSVLMVPEFNKIVICNKQINKDLTYISL